MGAAEEFGKATTSTVEALKGSPVCLVVMMLSLAFAVLTFYALQEDRTRQHLETVSLYERCFPLVGKDKE